MELNFVKGNNAWVAEFEATADFNIHIERVKYGNFEIYQRTSATGEYAFVASGKLDYQKVIDEDVVGVIYPKYIKIVSQTEPTLAIVTFNS